MSHVFDNDMGYRTWLGANGTAASTEQHRGTSEGYVQHHRPAKGPAFLPIIVSTDGLLQDDALRFLWWLADRSANKETAALDGLSASQDVSGDPTCKRIRSRIFRQLKASLSFAAIIAGAFRYASHSFGGGQSDIAAMARVAVWPVRQCPSGSSLLYRGTRCEGLGGSELDIEQKPLASRDLVMRFGTTKDSQPMALQSFPPNVHARKANLDTRALNRGMEPCNTKCLIFAMMFSLDNTAWATDLVQSM